MKKRYLILVLLSFINCKEIQSSKEESIVSLFEAVFYSTNLKNKEITIDSLNNKIRNSDPYYYKIIISDSLNNGVDYNFKTLDSLKRTPDINNLSICYKSKDSLLINNLVEKQEYLDKYLENIDINTEEIFAEFSIESNKSGSMNIREWDDSIKLLKKILKKITEKQIINKTNKPFRILFIFKGNCYLQPGPPPGNDTD